MTSADAGLDRRQYAHPPIEEAVCGVQIVRPNDPLQPMEPTLPGRLAATLGTYNGAAQQRPGPMRANFRLDQAQGGTLQLANFPRIFLMSEEGSRSVSVGADGVAAHALRPYEGWEQFRDRTQQALTVYAEIVQPERYYQVDVHYINLVTVATAEVDTSDYFKIALAVEAGLPPVFYGFDHQVKYFDPGDETYLALRFASLDTEDEGSSAFLLDLNVYKTHDDGEVFNVETLMSEIDTLRRKERDYFELLITDTARELFDA